MPISSLPPEVIHGPIGIYYLLANDESISSRANPIGLRRLVAQLYSSIFWQTKARLADARRRLSNIAYLACGWDSYGSEPPNATARSLAARILDLLEKAALAPTQLTPTSEGGIAFSFVEGNTRAVIEIYNTGEMAAATYSDQGEPMVWELEPTETPLLGSIEQIRVHLAA